MHYCGLKKTDIANGPGVRVSLFVSGCRQHCKGCFQPETWAFDYGEKFTIDTLTEVIEAMRPAHIEGLTILGGDPCEPENMPSLGVYLGAIRRAYGGSKTVWLYTGRLYDDVIRAWPELLDLVDVIVDGPFIEAMKSLQLPYRGSSNQRIIDVRTGKELKEYDTKRR